MNIYITFDYEIYFGEQHGTVEKCILAPTRELLRIGRENNARFVFFVDSGFVLQLDRYRKKFPVLETDYLALTAQIRELSDAGHDIQLHIHPHWEDSYFDGERWKINVNRYKLADFSQKEIDDIVFRYKKVLEDLTDAKIFAFRAGGWCLQPFDKIEAAFRKHGITLDSSVFRNGKFSSPQYAYDFTNSPDKDIYKFDHDPVKEELQGFFTELPISSIRNSPFFFWKLFLLGRKDPYLHKPLGDGRAMPAPGYRKKLLTRFTCNPVSADGYNSHLLQLSLNRLRRKGAANMVVIAHPKALSRYSIEMLSRFITENRQSDNFTTFSKAFL